MRSFRLVVLCTALAAAAALPPASAGARHCPMIVDQVGDVTISTAGAPPYLYPPTVERDDPALDLRSVDLTSDARSLTAVLRVVRLAALPSTAPLGGRWEVSLRLSGTSQFLYLWADTGLGNSLVYKAGYFDATLGLRMELGAVTGSFDVGKSEVRITAPLDLFESVAPLTKGTWLEGVVGLTMRFLTPGPRGAGNRSDATRSGAHRVGTRRCVR